MLRTSTLLLLFSLAVTPLAAQQEDPALAELLENFFRDNEGAGESDAQIFLERLDMLRQDPLDLNTASREELSSLQIISDVQVAQLLEYRTKLGALLSIYELQAVPFWETDDIRRLMPFVKVGNGSLDQRAKPLRAGFVQGDNELLLRAGRNVPTRVAEGAEGGPNSWALRYRHTFDGRLRFGFTAESDAGEAVFRKSNPQGFDFYSAHLFLNNTGGRFLKTLAIGDYSARMGQGLLLQTGFSPGKSAESTNSLLRSSRKLGAYSAFGEAFFLRGAGAIVSVTKHIDVQVFGSYRRRDASVDTIDADTDEVRFSSIVLSGLHRTPQEIEKEGVVTESLAGASVTWNHENGQISVNALHLRFDKPFEPTLRPYRLYSFTGKQLTGLSLDYQHRFRNSIFFGETARSDNGGIASLNGVLLAADRRVTFGLVHRYFQPEYQAVYAAPFAEVSGAANERGLYAGIEVRPSKPWKINAYADLWRHPWLRFGIDAPSSGNEYLVRILWQPQRSVQTYLIAQHETKESNAAAPENGLIAVSRNRFRWHIGFKVSNGVELRSRVEYNHVRTEGQSASTGFLAYQEAVVKPRNVPVSGTVRYAIFDTKSFDSRIYTFENDLFSAVSIPGFSGQGSRYYFNLTWRARKNLRVEGRYETTYLNRAITSGTKAGRQTAFKFQVRLGF